MKKYGIYEALSGDVTEVAINRPGEMWLEDKGGWRMVENPALTMSNCEGLAMTFAVFNKVKLDRDSSIASLTLPDGERCQAVLPPSCEDGTVSFTIRKPSSDRFGLRDYERSGRLSPKIAIASSDIAPWEVELDELAKSGNFVRFFEVCVERRLNILCVGGTGSGKTTFSKALVDLYPRHRRMITLEDSHELTLPNHPNKVHLFFGPHARPKEVLASCMRMKPCHIFMTELRGDESWDYLMALKSGHAGSVTTAHANDCRGGLYKVGSMIKQSQIGQTLSFEYIMREVETTIDVVIYFEHTHLKEIYYEPRRKLALLRGAPL